MQTQLRFYKENTGGWFVDLPGYPGPKADLAMVAGADTMLDQISNGGNECYLLIDTEPFKGGEEVRLLRERKDIGGGDYLMPRFRGQEINHQMWLCEVMLYVFGKLPELVFIRPVQ